MNGKSLALFDDNFLKGFSIQPHLYLMITILRFGEIHLEGLNLQVMKALWGHKVSDLDFADFVKKLVYIAAPKGMGVRQND